VVALLLVLIAVPMNAALLLGGRGGRLMRFVPYALSMITGYGLAGVPLRAQADFLIPHVKPVMTAGTVEAGRWLRAHSSPDDIVATNAHCRSRVRGLCENRHFWISAYSERRVLVEGWGNSDATNLEEVRRGGQSYFAPFWIPQRLRENDAAFRTPSVRTVSRLRDRYGVRWLFADAAYGGVSPAITRFATLRFRAGRCAVYEIGAGEAASDGRTPSGPAR
jgi:hypothetical protein